MGVSVKISDVPIYRKFFVWQTGQTFRLLARELPAAGVCGHILSIGEDGRYYDNEDFEQLVELVEE